MTDFRAQTRDALSALITCEEAELRAASACIAEDAVFDVAHPVNRLEGREAIIEGFVRPLRAALSHIRRRDEIFIGGGNIREPGGEWCAAVTHYQGNFDGALWGISPSSHLAFLRSGEFYRVENGRITEAKIIMDLIDLMRQAGRMVVPTTGLETLFPGPATHDGVLPDPAGGAASLDVVQGMLGDLHVFDPESFSSKDQTGQGGYWAEDMLWYGPAGIGSNYRWSGFVKDHRAPFLTAFPDRKGGNHYCRIGDGDYAAVSGWPSMTMTHKGPYLGVAATGKALTLRVMDFYRCAEGRIAENWVLLDYQDLMMQLGVDVIARGEAMR